MMKGAVFLLAFATTALAQLPEETPTPPIDPKIEFNVSIIGSRQQFHLGEIIPLKLAFTSRARERYQLDTATYDRSGRMNSERFVVTPSDGAVDPLAEYFASGLHMGGGLRGSIFLKRKPWTIDLDLNEWVRFTKPGDYKLRVASSRVEIVDSSKPHGTAPVTALSNEVILKILPRNPEWEKRTYDQAVATLKDPSSDKDKTWKSPALRALETLRFLGTADAARELANQLRAEEPRQGNFDCYIGLITSPEREVARQALEEALADPDRPIFDTLLDALVWLENHGEKRDANSVDGKGKIFEKATDALAHKRGEALRVSLYSLLNEVWVRRDEQLLGRDIGEKLISQLLETWDQLTVEQQTDLLGYRWEKIKGPALLPVLKRSAQHEETDLAGIALRRWFELDPDGARPAIISEISRPKPRFGAPKLGMLPDQTLPEVDQLLADHLRRNEDYESLSNTASLIARYATRAILSQVLKKLDPNIGKWACAIQNPLLAYVLRVDPETARSRIEEAIAARGKKFTACNRRLLEEISVIHYDPLLESIALRALDSPDEEVAGNAASLLADRGSAAAGSALWRRYEKWCKRWAGRESQVNLQAVSAHLVDGGDRDVWVGQSFVRSIAEGQGWLTDEPNLQRLRAMSKVPTIQADIDRYLEHWHRSALRLMISSCGSTIGAQPDVADLKRFSASVAHYSLDSRDALKEKLSQFPRGTKFEFWRPWDKADHACIDDLSAFLAAHDFLITEAKRDEGN